MREGKLIMDDSDSYGVEMGLQLVEAAGGGEVSLVSMAPNGETSGLAHRPRDGSRQGGPGLRPCARRLGRPRHGESPRRGDPAARCRTSCSPAPSPPTATPVRLPVQVAELLGWPSVSFAKHVEISDGVLRVQRQTEAGYDEVTCPLPAVVTVTAGVVEPRYPSFKGIMAAKSKPVEELTVADLGLDPSSVGEAGARQQVVSVEAAEARKAGEIVVDDGDAHERVISFLEQLKVL